MPLFLISYDLHKAKDYPKLYEKLDEWGAKRLLESVRLASLNGTASAIRNELTPHIDNDDSIAVIELKSGSDWACIRAKAEGVAWLKQNIKA